MNNRMDTFEAQQRQRYRDYLDSRVNPPFDLPLGIVLLPFEQWMMREFSFAQQALRELYDLVVEYDLNTLIEETAEELDRAQPPEAPQEWVRVLGILEGAKGALRIDEDEVTA